MAVKAAREKAQALSQQLGQQVGDPRNINESGGWYWASSRSWWGSRWQMATQNAVQVAPGGGQTDSALAPGLVAVSAQVTVSFELRR
jgi:uncharacterized protein YggE